MVWPYLSDLTLHCNSSPTIYTPMLWSHWAPFGPLHMWVPMPTMLFVLIFRPTSQPTPALPSLLSSTITSSEKSFQVNSIIHSPTTWYCFTVFLTAVHNSAFPCISNECLFPSAPVAAQCVQVLHSCLMSGWTWVYWSLGYKIQMNTGCREMWCSHTIKSRNSSKKVVQIQGPEGRTLCNTSPRKVEGIYLTVSVVSKEPNSLFPQRKQSGRIHTKLSTICLWGGARRILSLCTFCISDLFECFTVHILIF